MVTDVFPSYKCVSMVIGRSSEHREQSWMAKMFVRKEVFGQRISSIVFGLDLKF